MTASNTLMATNSEAQELPLLSSYYDTCEQEDRTPTLKDFLERNLPQVALNTDLRKDLKRIWSKRFQTAAKRRSVAVIEENIDWAELKARIQQCKEPSSTGSSSPRLSGKAMTEAAFAEVRRKYEEAIHTGNVWTLSTGKVVESVLLSVAMDTVYEHPIHSMIVNPDDPLLSGKFTTDELDEMRDTNAVEFDQALPEDLHEYLYSFEGMSDLDLLNDKLVDDRFHPTKQSDLFWARGAIENTANLYNFNTLSDDLVEDDLEYKVWFFVANCFQATEIRATSGKKKSKASTQRHNQSRTLASTDSVARQVSGRQPDMKCVWSDDELAFSEVSLHDDGENGTKELYESGLKAPKMMKDFFSSLARKYPAIIRKAKTAAFIITGYNITVIVMDSPQGSLCRLTYSDRAPFPVASSQCVKQLVPILELVYRVRLYLEDTVQAIKNDQKVVSIGRKGKKRSLIPNAIISPEGANPSSSSSSATTTSSNKKTKRN